MKEQLKQLHALSGSLRGVVSEESKDASAITDIEGAAETVVAVALPMMMSAQDAPEGIVIAMLRQSIAEINLGNKVLVWKELVRHELEMTDRPTNWRNVHMCSTLIQIATLVFELTE